MMTGVSVSRIYIHVCVHVNGIILCLQSMRVMLKSDVPLASRYAIANAAPVQCLKHDQHVKHASHLS